ncbi:MAG: hypothetical protein RIC80_21115 [Cyclobacteriaceae bacterium]
MSNYICFNNPNHFLGTSNRRSKDDQKFIDSITRALTSNGDRGFDDLAKSLTLVFTNHNRRNLLNHFLEFADYCLSQGYSFSGNRFVGFWDSPKNKVHVKVHADLMLLGTGHDNDQLLLFHIGEKPLSSRLTELVTAVVTLAIKNSIFLIDHTNACIYDFESGVYYNPSKINSLTSWELKNLLSEYEKSFEVSQYLMEPDKGSINIFNSLQLTNN